MNEQSAKRFDCLLATDLDGTLVGDDQACRSLYSFFDQQNVRIGLIYVTGRHEASARELIAAENLRNPDFLLTDVGTQIIYYPTGQADRVWKQDRMRFWCPDRIRSIARQIDSVSEQLLPVTCRVSFTSQDEKAVAAFRKALAAEQVPHVFIYSSGHDIDVLPAGSGKGAALGYLIPKIVKPDAAILVAGDSGNDRSMIEAGYPAVIVANAQPELRKIPDQPLVYRAKKAYAGGILEGWQYFFG